jgi:hypothetical protein
LCAIGVLLSTGACAFFSPLPDLRTPADRAREVEPRCKGFAEDVPAPLPLSGAVESVEPAYSYVKSGPNDRDPRLRGARLHVRPLPGLSRESMQRTLECHQANVTLHASEVRDEDPYVLPGRWVDIDVDSEGDGFVVAVQTESFDDARRILERGRRFVHNSRK